MKRNLIILLIVVLCLASFYVQARMRCMENGYQKIMFGAAGVYCIRTLRGSEFIIEPLGEPTIVPMFYLGKDL